MHDSVTRDSDSVTLAASKRRADPDDSGAGPLPWLPGIPDCVADHPSWGPYLSARSRRVRALAADVARREKLPRWTTQYDDVLTADLRRELAVWRAALGVPADGRSLVGPPPNDDGEAAYPRNLTNRINARYGEALRAWQERIVAYVGYLDEQTRKPLPVDHPTAALASRVKVLAARRTGRAAPVDEFRRTAPSSSGPTLGL